MFWQWNGVMDPQAQEQVTRGLKTAFLARPCAARFPEHLAVLVKEWAQLSPWRLLWGPRERVRAKESQRAPRRWRGTITELS